MIHSIIIHLKLAYRQADILSQQNKIKENDAVDTWVLQRILHIYLTLDYHSNNNRKSFYFSPAISDRTD